MRLHESTEREAVRFVADRECRARTVSSIRARAERNSFPVALLAHDALEANVEVVFQRSLFEDDAERLVRQF
jgi:hypothetical protein